MKYIIAIIQPDRMNEVMDELEKQNVNLVTVTQVMGHGRQRGEHLVAVGEILVERSCFACLLGGLARRMDTLAGSSESE